MSDLSLTSPAFSHNSPIPSRHTCDGENVNPPLEIAGVPDSAKSLVLVMDDPDVPKYIRSNGLWGHWIKFNIPPDTREIFEGREPEGLSGKGTAGNLDYHGPCPPDGEHRYFFKLYALNEKLNLPEGVSKAEIEREMEGKIIAHAELVGTYTRGL